MGRAALYAPSPTCSELLIAASDSADTPIISLDGDSPAVAATPIPSVVVAIASMMPVVRPTDINSEATSFKVHALSQSRRRCSGHRAQQSECDQRFRNPSHRVPSFLFRIFPQELNRSGVGVRSNGTWHNGGARKAHTPIKPTAIR